MREIKFRAWDGKKSKWCNTGNLTIEVGGTHCLGWAFGLGYEPMGRPQDSDYELMQYTGLKDKKNVEIYESDIVRLDNGTRNPYVVVWDDSFSGWSFGTGVGHNSLFSLYGSGVFEVIGNIYENPELVKPIV